MPSSAAASLSDDDDHHSPSDDEDPEEIDKDDDDDEEDDLEEMEEVVVVVEEEEEEEEEEQEDGDDDDDDGDDEEEEDGEDEEVGDDVSDSRIAADEDQNDVSQDMEFEGHDKHLKSGCSTLGKSEASLPSDTLAIEGCSDHLKFSVPSNEQLTKPKGESCMNDQISKLLKLAKHLTNFEDSGIRESAIGEKEAGTLPEKQILESCGEVYCKAYLSNSEIMGAETTNSSNVSEKEVAVANSKEANGVLYSEEGIKQMDNQSEEDKRMTSRLATPQTRLRSLSPDAEFKDGNKRPAIICEFFAKGWCIKGTSCKFLHEKDHLDPASQHPEGDVAAANWKSELLVDEGLGDGTERSSLSGFRDSLASSVGNNTSFCWHFPSDRIPPGEHGASRSWHQLNEKHKFSPLQREDFSFAGPPDYQRWPSSKDDSRFISSFKDVGRECLRQNWSADDYSSPIIKSSSPVLRNSLLPDYGSFSSGSVISSSTYRGSITPSSYAMSLEELASKQSQFSFSDHTSPVLSRYLIPGSNTSLPITGTTPSKHISSWSGSSLCYGSSSLNADPLNAQKLLDSDGEFRASRSASLLRSSSPFSGSQPEIVPPSSTGHKSKFSSTDWEPSVPFRPSFFIAPASISSPGSQYDPLRDSIEQPNIVDGSLKNSSYSPRVSILSTSLHQIYGDPVLTGNHIPEYNADKQSVSLRNKFPDNVSGKNYSAHGKDLSEAAGFFVSDQQNRNTVPKEEKPLGPTHVKDILKTNRNNIGHDRQHQSDGAIHKNESKVDRGRQNNEMDVDHKTDGDVQKESKASRHFRAALVDADRQHQSDGAMHKNESKVDRGRQNNEMDADHKTDGDVQKESKALRHFRAALVDAVKELLKPTWREGHLSKDAHNMIVKRAVDKVLSTLQPHQIPSTMESIKQYLSSSRPKIAKLVEGYVEKYRKS